MNYFRKTISYKYSLIIIIVLLILAVGTGVAFKSAQDTSTDNVENKEMEVENEQEDITEVENKDSEKETVEKEEELEESTTTTTQTTENTSGGGSSSNGGSSTQPPTSGKTVTVTISGSGFSPSLVTISAGDTIKWLNNDNRSHWPASDPHPQHTGYSGFDPKTGIGVESSWSFKFNNKGTWGYHDHQSISKTGTIIVN